MEILIKQKLTNISSPIQSLVRYLTSKFSNTPGCHSRLFESPQEDSEFLLMLDEKASTLCLVLCSEREKVWLRFGSCSQSAPE